jgi:hypothetical protein
MTLQVLSLCQLFDISYLCLSISSPVVYPIFVFLVFVRLFHHQLCILSLFFLSLSVYFITSCVSYLCFSRLCLSILEVSLKLSRCGTRSEFLFPYTITKTNKNVKYVSTNHCHLETVICTTEFHVLCMYLYTRQENISTI